MKRIILIMLLPLFWGSCKIDKGIINYPLFPEYPEIVLETGLSGEPYMEYYDSFTYSYVGQLSDSVIYRGVIRYGWDERTGLYFNSMTTLFYSYIRLYTEFGSDLKGPLLFDSTNPYDHFLMFSSDKDENQDLYFLYNYGIDYFSKSDTIFMEIPKKIRYIDTVSNEVYPTFYGKDFRICNKFDVDNFNKIEKMIWCSDKSGDFDIYSVSVDLSEGIYNMLSSTVIVEPDFLPLNSDADDICPYINEQLMVFASDRPGGYGGFDLYYSIYTNGNWSTPLNFGEKINSEYNEYLPMTIFDDFFLNNLMLFYSDRSGEDEYDLYFAGIDKKIRSE